jgi:hypothetical protein
MTPLHTPSQAASGFDSCRLEQTIHGRLQFTGTDGVTHSNVDIVRAFPISAPQAAVSILSADGAELAWIEPLEAAPESLRATVERELASRDFLPVIERIESISAGEPTGWSVVTDRGRRRFTVAHADDILRAKDDSVMVTDTDGVRYHIPSLAKLPVRERHLIDRAM